MIERSLLPALAAAGGETRAEGATREEHRIEPDLEGPALDDQSHALGRQARIEARSDDGGESDRDGCSSGVSPTIRIRGRARCRAPERSASTNR
jgi:hypothetical protein